MPDKPPRKLSMFERWFLKHSKRAWEHSMDNASERVAKPRELHFGAPTWNIMVHKAVGGGYAVEFVKYDINTDRHIRDLYVLADDTKLGDGLAQIITMQALKNS